MGKYINDAKELLHLVGGREAHSCSITLYHTNEIRIK